MKNVEDITVGLSSKEAEERLKIDGKNCLREEENKTVFQMFLEQIFNFTNFILAIAIVISIILGDYAEAAIILIIVIANGVIGVIQEGKAQKALEALKKMSILKATVIRDGEKKEISSEDLVVGDIVTLDAGQQVPADLRLLETFNLKIDEKALTGESEPIEKDADFIYNGLDEIGIGDRLDLAYMSTVVTYGRGVGRVEKVGMNTEIGKIADMVSSEKSKPSPLQKSMSQLSKILGIACVVICAIIFLVGLLKGQEVLDMLMVAVSLAVAAIPEGIPTIVTIVLALGMQRMAKVNAIVKNLPSVETLGSVSYVCSDKTGTLTQNKMTVVKTFANMSYDDISHLEHNMFQAFLNGFILCNDGEVNEDGIEIGDPTETALIAFAKKYNFLKRIGSTMYPRIAEKAFDSDRKLMTTLHTYNKYGHHSMSFTKGSTDELLKRCNKILIDNIEYDITDEQKELILSEMSKMSENALRVLSLAYRYDNDACEEANLTYVGMVGMIDPERPEVAESISTFKRAGIKTLMITGDHKITALAIARKLGIASSPNECIMGYELDKMTDEELTEKIDTLSIFARVSPEHKTRIVKALQNKGHIVSMTGDGVNDAPSLKAADVGVAMGITGTDVAKGAADIILQDDSFVTIEKAIKEGRNIYENVKKSILFALSSNISEILTMFIAIIGGLVAPLKATHILWVNLLTDSLPCFALGVDTNSSSDVMNKKPRKANESVFAGGGIKVIALSSIWITVITLIGFLLPSCVHLNQMCLPITLPNIIESFTLQDVVIRAQTYAFCILALSEIFHAVGMRDLNTSIVKFKFMDNKVMLLAIAVGFVSQIAVTEIPFLTKLFGICSLGIAEWLFIIVISASVLILHEIFVILNREHK